ncbi:MAG: hypothetical protein IT342_08355 [Candidatus Melainabacteria bacterium]|nr:hypothetical protein [Candidatus Melainabacteria bacterium]
MKETLSAIAIVFLILAVQQGFAAAPVKKNAPAKKAAQTQATADPVDAYIKQVSPKIQQAWKTPDKTTAEKVVVSLLFPPTERSPM